MHKKRRKKGVITVFSAISFALTVSLFLSLLESARIQGMKYFYPEYVNLQADNVLAHYDRDIYERFGLFGRCDTGALENTLSEYLNRDEALNEKDLLKGKSATVRELRKKLMTDDNGRAFQHLAASYMKSILPDVFPEKVKGLMSNYADVAEYLDGSKIMEHIDAAIDAVLKALSIARSRLYKTVVDEDGNEITVEDPEMRAVIEQLENSEILKSKERINNFTLLDLLPSGMSISKGRKLYGDPIDKRELKSGDMEDVVTDKAEYCLMLLYAAANLKSYLDQYIKPEDEHEIPNSNENLIYELEYVCSGKETDEENLSNTVKRIYIMRTSVHFLADLMDPSRVATAESIAIMLVGFTGLPFLIPLVKYGIIVCWSLLEAINDCKLLLSGKRIPIIPYVNIGLIQINYTEHILLLLMPKGTKKISYRIMDMIEEYSRKKMDNMVIALAGKVDITTDFKMAKAVLMVPIPQGGVNSSYDFYSKYYR